MDNMCYGKKCDFYIIDEYDWETCLNEIDCNFKKNKKIVDLDGESEYYGE